MKQLSALDAQFLGIENDRNYGHTGALAILDPSTAGDEGITLDRLKGIIQERLHLVPPFTQRLARVPLDLDWPWWVPDEHFDLGYHCREIALPPPGDMTQLAEQTARIYSRRLDRARPLWEVYLIHGLEGGRVAMVTKVHHAAVDGMSGAEILAILYDLTPEPRPTQPPSGNGEDGTARGRDLLLRQVGSLPRAPVRIAKRAGRLLPHVDVVPSVLGMRGAASISKGVATVRNLAPGGGSSKVIVRTAIRPPHGAYDGRLTPHRIFGLGSLPLAEVKAVKNRLDVKVNDVIVAVAAGAFREHLLRHDSLPDDPLVAQIPVNVRTDEERGEFGNEISMMFVPIPTDVDDPVERVDQAAVYTRAAKERHGALPAKAMRDAANIIPAALHARAARAMTELSPRVGVRPPFNVIISNVPGPPMDLYSAGARLESIYPLSIVIDHAVLNLTLLSYRDSIDFAITADRELTPDVQSIADQMPVELSELAAAE